MQTIGWLKNNKKKTVLIVLGVAILGVFIASNVFSAVSVIKLQGGFSSIESKVADVCKDISELKGRFDNHGSKIAALKKQTEALGKQTWSLDSRAAARVKEENQKFMEMARYIRGANPDSDLAKLTDKELDKLLNNGIWDVEPRLQSEYDRLIQAKVDK